MHFNFSNQTPLIIAHRGNTGKFPENTIEGFIYSLAKSKAQGIELDIHLTLNHEIVVVHDDVIGNIPVKTMTMKQIRILNNEIPTLYEVLQAILTFCDDHIPLGIPLINIEVKARGIIIDLLCKLLTQLIHTTSFDYSHFLITSFIHSEMIRVNTNDPRFRTGLIYESEPLNCINDIELSHVSVVVFWHKTISKELIREINRRKPHISIFIFTVNDEKTFREYCEKDCSIDGIITDECNKLFMDRIVSKKLNDCIKDFFRN